MHLNEQLLQQKNPEENFEMAEHQNQYSNTFKARSGTESSKRECKIIAGDDLT